MCQYDSRCRVGRHRPGTVCPYATRGSYGWSAAPPTHRVAPSAPSDAGRAGSAGRTVDWAPHVGAGGSGIDLLAWMLVLHWWDGTTLTAWGIALGTLLLAAPFVIGGELLSKCRAWINDGSRRCEQPRHGFLRRCADHRSQALTLYDVAGGLSILLGVLNVLVLMNVVLGGAP